MSAKIAEIGKRITAEFRAEALEILARREKPHATGVELHTVQRGVRLEIVGRDPGGQAVIMARKHFTDIRHAREFAALTGVVLGVPYSDFTGEGWA